MNSPVALKEELEVAKVVLFQRIRNSYGVDFSLHHFGYEGFVAEMNSPWVSQKDKRDNIWNQNKQQIEEESM